jgi:hypothetical protein
MTTEDAGTICVECEDREEPVTPENGVWVPGVDGESVPLHRQCVAAWTLKQEYLALGPH